MTLPQLINSEDALHQAILLWSQAPWLTVDTEFVREETYYPQLCLVQISDGTNAACVDAVALKELSSLWSLLLDGSRTKVLHAASQDLEIFVQLGGNCPAPLFDTQIAAGLLGIGDQIGYAGLVQHGLGITVDKSLSRTNWARRPLNAAELAYALDDVRHLSVLYPRLREQLAERGRLAWLEEDCAAQAQADRYRPTPELEWRRVKGLGKIEAPAQHRAAALATWREKIAIARNRPRRWILADDSLLRIAERQPDSIEQLKLLGALSDKALERWGSDILSVLQSPTGDLSVRLLNDERPDPAHRALVQRLQALVREVAEREDVPATMLASRSDLEAIIELGGAARSAALRGWRRALIGDALLAAI